MLTAWSPALSHRYIFSSRLVNLHWKPGESSSSVMQTLSLLLAPLVVITTTFFAFSDDKTGILIMTTLGIQCLNSLWPSDAIWRQGSRSTLVQVMTCCLTAPSHYLNQCWLIITKCLNDLLVHTQHLTPLLTHLPSPSPSFDSPSPFPLPAEMAYRPGSQPQGYSPPLTQEGRGSSRASSYDSRPPTRDGQALARMFTPLMTPAPDGLGADQMTPTPEPCNVWPRERPISLHEAIQRQDFEDIELFDTNWRTMDA